MRNHTNDNLNKQASIVVSGLSVSEEINLMDVSLLDAFVPENK